MNTLQTQVTPAPLKFCNGCKKPVPLVRFRKRTDKPNSYSSKCRRCLAAHGRLYYQRVVKPKRLAAMTGRCLETTGAPA